MLLMSRDYAVAAEEHRARTLALLEHALLTPTEIAQGVRLAPSQYPRHPDHPNNQREYQLFLDL